MSKLEPLKQWMCDSCHEIINSAEDGWVEWIDDGQKVHGFRIVHHQPASSKKGQYGCQYGSVPNLADRSLSQFVGNDGLIEMLHFIDVGPFHIPTYNGTRVKDLREWADLFRRLFLPYFEEARLYWDKAEADGFFSSMNELNVYEEDTLKGLIRTYGEQV